MCSPWLIALVVWLLASFPLALFLGWLLLNEPIGIWTILGAALVLVSVFGIFSAKHQQKPVAPAKNDCASESA